MKGKSKIFLILVAMMLCACFIGGVSAAEGGKGLIDMTSIKESISNTDISKMTKGDLGNMLIGATRSQLAEIISTKSNMEEQVLIIVSSPELKSNAKLEMQNEVFGMTPGLSDYLKSKSTEDDLSKPIVNEQKEIEWNSYLFNYVTYYKATGEFGGPIV